MRRIIVINARVTRTIKMTIVRMTIVTIVTIMTRFGVCRFVLAMGQHDQR